ncbi:alanine--tRNA ligase [bacterium]|nr:alanine--tRNA ligase [bacterium]
MRGSEIRRSFLDFFVARGHTEIESDLLVPRSDPTLLFTSAGMVQFKAHFLGQATDGLTRATTCQKCFRTSDIENVGYTARHHTFFEMLGNFSFGDYFKREAIAWGWEWVTQVLRIPVEDLWVTHYEEDEEAAGIWEREIGVARDRIVATGKKDNWWGPVGDSGPCGPCSEIHVDRGPSYGEKNTIHDGGDRFVEIWNLVFTQYDQQKDGRLVELPRKNIDTGAGLERIASVMQDVPSNFETDLLRPLLSRAEELSGKRYGSSSEISISMRVLADHGRAITFCIADGVLPANLGRGYVLRRIIRRAVRHGRRLGIDRPFLSELADVTVEVMHDTYPELAGRLEYVKRVALAEEQAFAKTLLRGTELLDQLMAETRAGGGRQLPGEELFRLFDTYGFPYDLTEEIAREQGLDCDRTGFEAEMEKQRQRARAAWKGSGQVGHRELPAELLSARTTFLGYDELESQECEILAILCDDDPVESLEAGRQAEIILDRTPFYAEAGGQVGDVGVLEAGSGAFQVEDTQKTQHGVYLHRGRLLRGVLKPGEHVTARVDRQKRSLTMAHHSATHLLQAALRQVLGGHVQQSGSRVSPDSLRFDFTHFEAVSPGQMEEVERRVNAWVWENLPVVAQEMDLEEARRAGALAFFGEKYGERVRVVRMGDVSQELCGGTHVRRTGDIGLVALVKESSISAGNRRVEGLAGARAWERLKGELLAERRKSEDYAERLRRLEKELGELRAAGQKNLAARLAGEAAEVGGARFLVRSLNGVQDVDLDTVMDGLKDRLPNAVIVLADERDGRVVFLCTVSDNLVTQGLHAGHLVKELAQLTGGGGGGKPTRAQAGGKDPSKLGEALALAERRIRETLSKRG